MANPNIVNVVSIYGESIGKGLSTDVTTVILTVLANKLLKINYISVANLHATAACDVSVKITKASGGFTSAGVAAGDDEAGIQSLASTVSCPADDVLVVLEQPIYLMELDNLEAGASGAADIFISYEVISV